MADRVVRASSLPEFADCQRRWAAKMLHGEVVGAGYTLRELPPSIGAAVGTGAHAAIAHVLIQKMQTGQLGTQAEAEERGVQALEESIEGGAIWDDVTPGKANAQRQIGMMTEVYRRTIAPKVKPIDVETRLQARHSTGIVLSGQSDLVTIEPAILVDQKTGKMQRSHFAQYGSYTILRRSHGKPVIGAEEHFHKRVPVSKAQPDPVVTQYDIAICEQQTEATLQHIAKAHAEWRKTYDPGAFLPNPSSMLCSDRYCPAWGSSWCRTHKGATTASIHPVSNPGATA